MDYKNNRLDRLRFMFSGLGKTAVIYPAAFLVALGGGMFNFGIIFFMREVYTASPSLIGWLLGIGTLIYVTGCLFLKPVFERYKPRYLMIGASIGMILFLVLLQLIRSVPLTFLFFGLHQLSNSFFWPPVMGWLARDMEGTSLNRAMSRFNMSWSIGLLISPSLAGILSEQNPGLPLKASVIVFGCMLLLVTGAALAVPSIRKEGDNTDLETGKSRMKEQSTPLRFPAWIGLFSCFVVTGMVISIFPIYARDVLLLSKSLVGSLLSLRILVRVIAFFFLGRVTFWHFRGRYQLMATAFLVVLMIVMLGTRVVWMYALLISLVSMGNAFIYSNSMFHSVAGTTRRASRLAVHEALLAGGYILGSTSGGILFQYFSFSAVIMFCALCCGAALLAQVIVLIHIRRKNISPGM